MRILQVAHGFPPFSKAGAEVFAYGLSRALVRQGHEVTVFHRFANRSEPEYSVERGEVDGLPVIRINNTFQDCDRFEKTYRNQTIDRHFGEALDRERPDVVHFHHVTCLSVDLISEAHRRGIPIVYTLHDYWLICQRGQFLKRDLSPCPGQEDGECVKCLTSQLNLTRGRAKATRMLKRAIPALDTLQGAGAKRLLKGAYDLYASAFHGSRREELEQVRARMQHVRDVCSTVDAFVSPSRFLKERFVDFGIPEDRIVYSTLGFNKTYYDSVKKVIGEGMRFGYLGTWIPPKGLHVLIEAFNGFSDVRATLHIYGYGLPYEGYEDYEGDLEKLIQSPRIFLEGPYDNKDVGEILAKLDVLVVPSIWQENSPLTVQEAFLAGVPVIVSRLGGMEELVQDEVNGLTFEPRDSSDLRAKMMRFVCEPGLLARLRPKPPGVKSLEESAEEHLRLFRKLQRKRQPAAVCD